VRTAVADGRAELPLDGLELGVDRDQVGDFLGGHPPQRLTHQGLGTHGGEQSLGLQRRQVALGPAGDQLGEQPLQPVHRLHPTLGQLVAAVGQQPQRDQRLVVTKLVQPPAAHRHHRHRVRAGRVGLAGVAGVEHPHPRGQLRRHVDHDLPVGQQPLGQRPACSVRALDRPPAVRPLLPHVAQHQPVPRGVGAEPAG
jgi:hypothetical protein